VEISENVPNKGLAAAKTAQRELSIVVTPAYLE
jgi:hypothetical protein